MRRPINLAPTPTELRHAHAIRDYDGDLCLKILGNIDALGRRLADQENWWLRDRRRALAARLRHLGIPLPKRHRNTVHPTR